MKKIVLTSFILALTAIAFVFLSCNNRKTDAQDDGHEIDLTMDEADGVEEEGLEDVPDIEDTLDIPSDEVCECDGGCDFEGREPERIFFLDVGGLGIYDPSLEAADPEGSRIWMSYSAVEPPENPECRNPEDPFSKNMQVETRLAFSDDHGGTWQDAGLINDAENFCTTLTPPRHIGTWVHEVSTIAMDPGAPPDERWKLFWHSYMWVDDDNPSTDDRLFQHGWISMRTSADPGSGWSPERKLFVGSLYDSESDSRLGPPEIRLNEEFPELADCALFTEAGAYGNEDGLYLAMNCFELPPDTDGNRIILMKLSGGSWQYVGTLLNPAPDAQAFGYVRFNAAEIFSSNSRIFLLATPSDADHYSGCMLFEILDIDTARLLRDSEDIPTVLMTINGSEGSFNGPCGYDSLAFCSGIINGEVFPDDLPFVFRLFKSFKFYP